MKALSLHPGALAYGSAPLDGAMRWIVKLLLLFMPLALGAVQAWSELVVTAAAATLALLLAWRTLADRNTRLAGSWALVPLALFAALVTLQLIPLPAGVVQAVSPASVSLRGELLADLPPRSHLTLSFYPHATLHDLRLVVIVAILFIVTLNVFRRTHHIRGLLAWVAAVGALIAAIALLQKYSHTGLIYGVVPTGSASHNGGPFQNQNHLAQFLNLSIGAALAWMLVRLHEELGRDCSLPRLLRYWNRPELRALLFPAGAVLICLVALFLSMSRTGMISGIVALAFSGLLLNLTGRTSGRGWLLSIIALVGFSLLLLLGFDTIYARLATLQDLPLRYEGRWQILTDLVPVYSQFPLLGTGLGTHATFYPLVDRSGDFAFTSHAENNYAQMAAEVGFIGLGLILAFLGIVTAAVVHTLRRTHRPISTASIGLASGLLAVIIHSWTDFGQHLTAVTCLTAITCALIIRIARDRDRDRSTAPDATPAAAPSRFPRFAALAVLLIAATWSTASAATAFLGANAFQAAADLERRIRRNPADVTDAHYATLLDNASRAASLQPKNVHYAYRHQLARWRSIARQTDPLTRQATLAAADLPVAADIIQQLNAARTLCPTFGPAPSLAGQIDRALFNTPAGHSLIRLGYRLAPHDPTACFAAGLLEGDLGNYPESLAAFSRIRNRGFQTLARYYTEYYEQPHLAVELAGDSPAYLLSLSRLLTTPEHQPLALAARARATELLKSAAENPNASAHDLASLASLFASEDDHASAIACYRRALDANYGNVHWRLGLARSLAAVDDAESAIREARLCLRLRPQLKGASDLIARLSTQRRPATQPVSFSLQN